MLCRSRQLPSTALLREALLILEQRQRVQWELRALQLKSDGDWPTLEYGMQLEWLLEASEVLPELLEQRLE